MCYSKRGEYCSKDHDPAKTNEYDMQKVHGEIYKVKCLCFNRLTILIDTLLYK